MTIKNIIKNFVDKFTVYNAEYDRIEKQIKRLKRKLNKLKYPSWVDEVVEPIAKEMLKKMPTIPHRYYEILGPFGLTCETSIHFYKITLGQYEDKLATCKSISFRPTDLDNGNINLVDYTKNNSTIPMKKSITELIKFMDEKETVTVT